MLLADENIPGRTIIALRMRGIDVVSVAEMSAGLPDDAVLQLAVQEQRALVSFDRDYGELIFRYNRPPPPSIIYFRLLPQSAEDIAEMLVHLLRRTESSIVGKMVIVSRQGIRERRFPQNLP